MSTTPPERDTPTGEKSRSGPARGADERRETVNPAENPAPRSPEPDHEAVKKGEETLERIKPY
jgi:hypothetical protein